jgi:hypothetical protein
MGGGGLCAWPPFPPQGGGPAPCGVSQAAPRYPGPRGCSDSESAATALPRPAGLLRAQAAQPEGQGAWKLTATAPWQLGLHW